MRKSNWFSALQYLTYLSQVGLSLAAPIVLCLLGATWAVNRFGVGEWVYLLAIVLGIGGGVSAFVSFARYVSRQSKKK